MSITTEGHIGALSLDVKELCRREGIENAHQLAEITGLPYAVCWRLWRGTHSHVGMSTLEALCDGLRVRPGQLFSYTAGG